MKKQELKELIKEVLAEVLPSQDPRNAQKLQKAYIMRHKNLMISMKNSIS